jgi:gamma-glutamyl hercynylcysteine S-oxide synthase
VDPDRVDATRTALAERLEATRARTLALYGPLPHEHLVRPPSPLLSPPLWDLGHIGAYEELWLARRLAGRRPIHPELDDVYDAFETPRAARGDVRILSEREALDYLARVRESSLDALGRADLGPEAPALTAGGFVFEMVAEHEAQHSETVLQALQMLPAGAYAPPARRPLPAGDGPSGGWVEIPGGSFAMGAPDGGFAYDCERPRHVRELAPFLMARDPVGAGEHLEFMSDGGYRRPELWTTAGWRWRQAEGAEAPLYWERDGEGGWLVRLYDRVEPVDPARPVCHLSAHEADAHARWAGARLPTECEWERAAAGARADAESANLDQLAFGIAPVGAYPEAPSGCRGMMGDVWEWTSTAFDGYPGFRAHPYREYAEVFFGRGHRVLRGGSWATQPIAARTTFRNWDLPQRRQIFSGLRLARDLG